MSDDDDQEHDPDDPPDITSGFLGGVPAIFAGALPPEMAEHMRSQQAQYEMTLNADVHGRLNLLEEFDRTTLEYMRGLVSYIGAADSEGSLSGEAATYHEGLFTGLLWQKFGVCPNCRVNHQEELEKEVNSKPDDGGTDDHE